MSKPIRKNSGAHSEIDAETTVRQIIAKQLKMPLDQVCLDAHMKNDLGVESLDALEIILSVEEAFDIDIPDEDARKAATVQDIVQYIQHHSRAK